MSAITDTDQPQWKKIAGMAGLALLGAVFGAGLALFTDGRFADWADEANFFLGVTLILMAAVSGVIMAVRPSSVPRGCGLLQIAVLVLAGLILLTPIAAPSDLLDSAAERLAGDLGFTLDVGHVALSGTCRACREKAESEN